MYGCSLGSLCYARNSSVAAKWKGWKFLLDFSLLKICAKTWENISCIECRMMHEDGEEGAAAVDLRHS